LEDREQDTWKVLIQILKKWKVTMWSEWKLPTVTSGIASVLAVLALQFLPAES
jgi:hypothetical protein